MPIFNGCESTVNIVLFLPGEEYCMMETFHGECPENHIIMMREALYGMMEKNRCIQPGDDLSKC